jgi:glycerophosphoryl diester phosphodiesterase
MRYLDGPRPRIFGHRGAAGVAPENTLVSFRAALAQGADRLELDVHGTLDGHVVVLHDASLDRTTDGSGEVRAMTLEAVRRLDAGARFAPHPGLQPIVVQGAVRVPTLDEVLAELPEVALNIEVKQGEPTIVSAVLATLDRHAARPRVLLAAEHDPIMADIRAAAPDVLTGFTASEAAAFFESVHGGPERSQWPGVALQVPSMFQGVVVVDAAFVSRAHAQQLEVHVWTVNEAEEVARLVALGVDGLITDVPAVAARAIARG